MTKPVHHIWTEPMLASWCFPVSGGGVYGFKHVNGHQKNTKAGLKTVTASVLLAEMGIDSPVLPAEMTVPTGLRTAATSRIVAKHLSPKGSHRMAMIDA